MDASSPNHPDPGEVWRELRERVDLLLGAAATFATIDDTYLSPEVLRAGADAITEADALLTTLNRRTHCRVARFGSPSWTATAG